jgi:two-component system osmolarity sensor histidine kinase EnvZ
VRLRPLSLRWRTLSVLVVALVLSQATALWLFDRYITQPRVAVTMTSFVSHLKTVAAALETMGPEQELQFTGRVAERDGIRILTNPGNLQPLEDRPALKIFKERLVENFGPRSGVFSRHGEPLTPEGRPRTVFVRLPVDNHDYFVAFPRTRIERDTTTALIAWGVVGVAIAILGTFFMVSWLNRPLSALARAAQQIGQGREPQSLAESGPREIRDVARAFNQMKDDLRRNERDRATFLAGISHDLRTPLARMRLDVEMLESRVDPAVQRGMIADLADMNAIIDQFIDFTRSESDEPLSGVNLSELSRACAERAIRSGLDIRCDLGETPLFLARPLAMQRLVDNLLVNAGRHAGGPILLTLRHEEGVARLSVLDRGPGIPADMVERLKQPFTRRDEARSGSSGAGLGLAIVERVARIHGGSLQLLAREGGGLEARVTLPLPNAAG